MDDSLEAARSDLAFLKAVAEDRGPLPALLGWHLIALGAVIGADFIHIWAVYADLLAWPIAWRSLVWVPGVAVYLVVNLLINLRGGSAHWGPGARLFGAAWASIALMIPPAVLVLLIAQQQTGYPFHLAWPALAFIFYGGAWTVVAMVRKRLWFWLVATGCFATGLLCAAMIRDTAQWLVMSAGLFIFVALPGAAIVAQSRPAR